VPDKSRLLVACPKAKRRHGDGARRSKGKMSSTATARACDVDFSQFDMVASISGLEEAKELYEAAKGGNQEARVILLGLNSIEENGNAQCQCCGAPSSMPLGAVLVMFSSATLKGAAMPFCCDCVSGSDCKPQSLIMMLFEAEHPATVDAVSPLLDLDPAWDNATMN
jgi:hypothetical protein